jgi:hypothetical protein
MSMLAKIVLLLGKKPFLTVRNYDLKAVGGKPGFILLRQEKLLVHLSPATRSQLVQIATICLDGWRY